MGLGSDGVGLVWVPLVGVGTVGCSAFGLVMAGVQQCLFLFATAG